MGAESEPAFILDKLKVASPCPKLWSEMEMTAEEAVRFCGDCRKNVYDVSKMTTEETQLLVQKASAAASAGVERSLCLQIYRRADGTVMTDDCPVGLRRVRDFYRRVKTSVAAALALFCTQIGWQSGAQAADTKDPANGNAKSSQKAERGEATVMQSAPGKQAASDNSAPVPMRTGGIVSPNFQWEIEAQRVPEINALLTKVNKLQCKTEQTKAERLEQCRLQLEIARLGDKKNMINFAQSHYLYAQNLAEMYPEQKALLKTILIERKVNDAKVGGYARADIDKKLKEIGE